VIAPRGPVTNAWRATLTSMYVLMDSTVGFDSMKACRSTNPRTTPIAPSTRVITNSVTLLPLVSAALRLRAATTPGFSITATGTAT
jgi:hypothetical protein